MSTLNVDKVDPNTGTALELGTSGDTITVPTGAGLTVTDEVKTNKISPATGTAFALGDSGDTFTIPSGATITNSGTANGFGGGLANADQWRLTTGFTGDANPIASNWEQNDTAGFGALGSSMTESSGIFSFPSTGYWLVTFTPAFNINGDNRYAEHSIWYTANNSSYAGTTEVSSSITQSESSTTYQDGSSSFLFDITDVANQKVRFKIDVSNTSTLTMGHGDKNSTYVTFMRLADT